MERRGRKRNFVDESNTDENNLGNRPLRRRVASSDENSSQSDIVVEVGSEEIRQISTSQIPPSYSFTSRPILSSLLPMLTRASFRVPRSQMSEPLTARSIIRMNTHIPNNWVRQQLLMERNRQHMTRSSNRTNIQLVTLYFRAVSNGRESEPVEHTDGTSTTGASLTEISKYTVEKSATENIIHDNCVICLSKFILDEKIRTLSCTHSFHSSCIDGWFTKSRLCPICRKNLAY